MAAEVANVALPDALRTALPQRIDFPMHLLDEPTRRCSPDDHDREWTLTLTDRKVPFLLLYQTLVKLGCRPDSYTAGHADLGVYWTAKQVPDSERDRAIIMEVAWLPRWQYQVSPSGSNALGHFAEGYEFAPLAPDQERFVKAHLRKMQAVFEASVNPENVERLRRTLPSEFVLFALQLANDFNLKSSGTSFARFYSPLDEQSIALAQACVDATQTVARILPIVYRQHPSDRNAGLQGKLNGAPLLIDRTDRVTCHEIFATGRCRAVISINSNTTHEAAAWNIPSICLGRLIWPKTGHPPFPADPEALESVLHNHPHDDDRVLSYLHYLIRHQWTLTDFQQPLMVEAMLSTHGRCEPAALRAAFGLT